jgi:hypothetical protein
VMHLRGAEGGGEEHQQSWNTPREHSADDEPHPREGDMQADGQTSD